MTGQAHMKKSGPQQSQSPSQLIDGRIKELGDFEVALKGLVRAAMSLNTSKARS